MNNIEAVIFDFFGVLAAYNDQLVCLPLAAACAEPATALAAIGDLTSNPELIRARVGLAELHDRLRRELGLSLSYEDFAALWRHPYSWPLPGVRQQVEALARRYRLVLLSNVDAEYWQVVQPMHPELEGFAALLLSCELGCAKPEPAAFAAACAAVGAPPERCFFVDDKAENVEAARALGIEAWRFTDTPALVAELARRGML